MPVFIGYAAEVVGFGCLVAAAYIAVGLWLCLVVLGCGLIVAAQASRPRVRARA